MVDSLPHSDHLFELICYPPFYALFVFVAIVQLDDKTAPTYKGSSRSVYLTTKDWCWLSSNAMAVLIRSAKSVVPNGMNVQMDKSAFVRTHWPREKKQRSNALGIMLH